MLPFGMIRPLPDGIARRGRRYTVRKRVLWTAICEVKVEIRVSHESKSVVFTLSKRSGFDFFVVSNAEERIFWELKPLSMQPAPVIEAEMSVMRVPRGFEDTTRTMQEIVDSDEGTNPPLGRIVYGEVPAGYREVVKATPLSNGEKYCAFLFGDGFETVHEYFVF